MGGNVFRHVCMVYSWLTARFMTLTDTCKSTHTHSHTHGLGICNETNQTLVPSVFTRCAHPTTHKPPTRIRWLHLRAINTHKAAQRSNVFEIELNKTQAAPIWLAGPKPNLSNGAIIFYTCTHSSFGVAGAKITSTRNENCLFGYRASRPQVAAL